MSILGENRYGKARVRVMKVTLHADHHDLKEWSVRVLLHGDFETSFTIGDNSLILPTDTMKNTVYSLARGSKSETLEAFAQELATYLLANNPQVSNISVEIEEKNWEPVSVNGSPHPFTFQLFGPALATTKILQSRSSVAVSSGIEDLTILKTTKSAFTGYIKDRLTTLPETTDRIFATRATAEWNYNSADIDFTQARSRITTALINAFAEHNSLSVQHTLFAMGRTALDAEPAISEIKLTLPNIHCLLVDLSRFGQDNPNQIFIPTDEPHGYIEATVHRS